MLHVFYNILIISKWVVHMLFLVTVILFNQAKFSFDIYWIKKKTIQSDIMLKSICYL